MSRYSILAVCTFSLSAMAAAPSSYTIVDLGPDQQPMGANKYGVAVGYTISSHVPVEYQNGIWARLAGTGTGFAYGINSNGTVVGWNGQQVEWKNGKRKQLAGTGRGAPEAISDDGTIVGNHWGGSYDSCYSWKQGVKSYVPGLDGGDCYAYSIDRTGTYIGGKDISPNFDIDYEGFVMGPAGTAGIGALGGSFATSIVHAVNRHGHAAGQSTFDETYENAAVYWNGTQLIDIGLHPPGSGSVATAINSSDDVLVLGSDGAGHVLFLYSGRTGTTAAIEPLISNPAGWAFDYSQGYMAAALTDDGSIFGAAHFNGELHAFRLVPAH